MEHLLNVYDKLRNIYTLVSCDQFEISPIVIIGDQDAGKSSLLENLLGCSFLPEHTRCPIHVQVIKKENKDIPDWSVLSNAPNCLITDFKHVRYQIDLETKNKLDANKCIHAEPMLISIHSNNMLNLSFIDLPGLRKISNGNQLKDIEKYLTSITLEYISKVNAIILVVISVDRDVLSNDALKLAQQVDPEGLRTLIVISKIDLIENQPSIGKQLNEIFTGKIKLATLNIIAVISNKLIGKDENLILRKLFPQIAHKHGRKQLINSIYHLMLQSFNEFMPKLQNSVKLSYWKYKQKLANYGGPIEDEYKTLLELVSNFTVAYTTTILGPFKELATNELTGGARLNYIFIEVFGQTIRKINPLDGFSKETLLTAIRNASGIKSTIFIPDICFELLIRKEIMRLKGPSLKCVQLVFEEMEKLIYNCESAINSQFCRFPKLKQKIISTALDLIKSRIYVTNDMVEQLINIHMTYINTGHPDFVRQCREYESQSYLHNPVYNNCQVSALVTYQGGDNVQFNVDNKSKECFVVEKFIVSYFNIIRTAIEDSVPKTIMHFLVNFIVENLQSELVARLFSNGLPDKDIMRESNEIIQERKRTIDILHNHEDAIKLISEICESLK